MAGKIFINYRRGEDSGFVQALLGRLEQTFSREQVFIDIEGIEPGIDFVRALDEQVAQCDVLLAVIGKGWLDARDEANARRIDNPEDLVRIEIASALGQDKRVIPVLVGDARMPRSDELPDVLKPLAKREAVRLTHERFRADTESFVQSLKKATARIELARKSHEDATADEGLNALTDVGGIRVEVAGKALTGPSKKRPIFRRSGIAILVTLLTSALIWLWRAGDLEIFHASSDRDTVRSDLQVELVNKEKKEAPLPSAPESPPAKLAPPLVGRTATTAGSDGAAIVDPDTISFGVSASEVQARYKNMQAVPCPMGSVAMQDQGGVTLFFDSGGAGLNFIRVESPTVHTVEGVSTYDAPSKVRRLLGEAEDLPDLPYTKFYVRPEAYFRIDYDQLWQARKIWKSRSRRQIEVADPTRGCGFTR
jgi:hypothetical protein